MIHQVKSTGALLLLFLHVAIAVLMVCVGLAYRTKWVAEGNSLLWLGLLGGGLLATTGGVVWLCSWHLRQRRRWRILEVCLREVGHGEQDSAQAIMARLSPLPVGKNLSAVTRGWNRILGAMECFCRDLELAQAESHVGQFLSSYDSQRLLVLIDSLADGIILVDAEGQILLVNRRCQGQLGRPLSEMLGHHVLELFTDSAAHRVLEGYIGRNRQGGDSTFEVVVAGAETAGEAKVSLVGEGAITGSVLQQRTVLGVSCHCLLSEGDRGDLLLVLRDITQQKVSQASQHEFIVHVSHELRNPLANIRAYAETLLSDMILDISTQKEAFNVINEETQRLSRLVNEVLDLAQMETGSMKLHRGEVVMDRLVRQCVSDVQAMAASKKITIQSNYHPKLPNLSADRDKLAVAIHNILSNAIKYTLENGTVFMETNVDQDHVYIKVADTGLGIAAEDLERIFEKFYRVQREETARITGSGLGLATAKEIIQRHGGMIHVTSQLNKGTEMVIHLPLKMVSPVLGTLEER